MATSSKRVHDCAQRGRPPIGRDDDAGGLPGDLLNPGEAAEEVTIAGGQIGMQIDQRLAEVVAHRIRSP